MLKLPRAFRQRVDDHRRYEALVFKLERINADDMDVIVEPESPRGVDSTVTASRSSETERRLCAASAKLASGSD